MFNEDMMEALKALQPNIDFDNNAIDLKELKYCDCTGGCIDGCYDCASSSNNQW